MRTARRLWGRSLDDERDRRLRETHGDDVFRDEDADWVRAVRGHVTRELRMELTERLQVRIKTNVKRLPKKRSKR